MQRAWSKYGESAFEFSVLEKCDPERCIDREQFWIDYFEASDRNFGYNLSPTAGSTLGLKQTDAAKANMSAAMQRIKHEIAERMQGNKNGRGNLGKVPSEEKRKQIADKLRGRKTPDHVRAKLKKTPDQLEAMRQRALGRKQSPETIAKRVAKLRGMKRGPEALAAIRAGAPKREQQRREARYGSDSRHG